MSGEDRGLMAAVTSADSRHPSSPLASFFTSDSLLLLEENAGSCERWVSSVLAGVVSGVYNDDNDN